VDEIHRFNKAQQDAFLHHVESGLITLIGATTENPSFEVISPLMSRCRVIVLEALLGNDISRIIKSALDNEEYGLGREKLQMTPEALQYMVHSSAGDARVALNNLELAANLLISRNVEAAADQDLRLITLKVLETAMQRKALVYDKSGEEHYNLISALHKSMRGSDPDAALYWLVRMLEGGEDPLYIARRMVRFAAEDIGNADPNALQTALSCMEAYRFLGSPEGELALAQAAIYLSTAPKSNRIYQAYKTVKKTIDETGALAVPMHIRNAPTNLMRSLGYGKGYQYAHDYRDAIDSQEYLPESIKEKSFYIPSDRGYEALIKKRLEKWYRIKEQLMDKKDGPPKMKQKEDVK
jgi:putative ATPase